ncbi:MAG: Hsp33 family molecular chaperone HslO [Chloroflexi bacterium]|nr:Hsp33 family molecular chaperone HslO [Chloroflexota bacterium]
MTDYLLRTLSASAGLRGLACVSTDVVDEAARRHRTSPLATAVLGYGLTGAALLGALLKVRQRVAVKVEANGPVGKVVAESDAYGRLRGYVPVANVSGPSQPTAEDVADALGRHGVLLVVKDLRLKHLYEGAVELQTGRLDDDLTYYLEESEQIPSIVRIGVEMSESGELVAAGGALFQVMPGFDEKAWAQVLARLDALDVGKALAEGGTPEEILTRVFGDIEYEVLEKRELRFECHCSREQTLAALKLLDRTDLEALIEEGEAEVTCQFCGQVYAFDREELEEILAEVTTDAG